MSPARTVHLVAPEGVGDPGRPSGGNTYDRRLCQELAAAGWSPCTHEVAGRRGLERALEALPDRAVVLVDGLVGSPAPELLVPASRRLRVVVLMHMPIHSEAECLVLRAAAGVVTTSDWTRRWLLSAYALDPARVHVAHPGGDPAEPAPGTVAGSNLLCVGAVTPGKGHDVLLRALARVADLPWRCLCVGALARAPEFVTVLRRTIRATGLEDRLVLAGPRTGPGLEASYAVADLLVLASHAETYGMVVTEALARGLPVLASDVGGVPEALGTAPDGRRPGVLLPPGDAGALADSLRRWLSDERMRQGLREAAHRRRTGLTGWSQTAERVARVLQEVAA